MDGGGEDGGDVEPDPCLINNGGCDVLTTCTNSVNGPTCGPCPSGYAGTGLCGCIDVNECFVDNGGCSVNATCANTSGSRLCTCNSGYGGDGFTCTAIPTVCGESGAFVPSTSALLDVGHSSKIICLRRSDTRTLSADRTGRWILWNITNGARLASGSVLKSGSTDECSDIQGLVLAGDIVATRETPVAPIVSRSALTGQILSSIPDTSAQWGLSSDGSYIWAASTTALSVWTIAGESVFVHPGNYASAQVFASPTEMRVALGPLGNALIEPISVPSGISSTALPFAGSFHSWFQEGQRFFTAIGSTLRVYSMAGVQDAIVAMPTLAKLTGQGDYYWTFGTALTIYKVGNDSTPVATYPESSLTKIIGVEGSIGVVPYGESSLDIIQLGPNGISRTTEVIGTPYLSAVAISPSGAWVVGSRDGQVQDHASGASTLQSLGCGAPLSVSGSPTGMAALSTASGKILLLNLQPTSKTFQTVLNFPSSHVELSADSSVLVASGITTASQYWNDRSLRVYSMPTASQTYVWPYAYGDYPTIFSDFSFARSGLRIAHLLGTYDGNKWIYTRKVTDSGGAVLFTETSINAEALRLSPDGTIAALSSGGRTASATTQLYKNLTLSGALSGYALGWISDDRVLVNSYNTRGQFEHAIIYDSEGSMVSVTTLPEIEEFMPISSTLIYDKHNNLTYDLQSGDVVWSGPPGWGTIAGDYAVSIQGSLVFAEKYH